MKQSMGKVLGCPIIFWGEFPDSQTGVYIQESVKKDPRRKKYILQKKLGGKPNERFLVLQSLTSHTHGCVAGRGVDWDKRAGACARGGLPDLQAKQSVAQVKWTPGPRQ